MGNILKIDILVEDVFIVEIKAVDAIIPIFKAQLLTYLKLSELPKGLLINFNSVVIKDSVSSKVTDIYQDLNP